MTKQGFLGFLADMNSVYQGMTKMMDDVTSGTAATKEPVLGLQVQLPSFTNFLRRLRATQDFPNAVQYRNLLQNPQGSKTRPSSTSAQRLAGSGLERCSKTRLHQGLRNPRQL